MLPMDAIEGSGLCSCDGHRNIGNVPPTEKQAGVANY